ncbi:MAG TPA: efflux RND transporter periplasmic adaptor subunit [Bryobacteraceae bacterium]|jgi:RND family efflux transporter MFP subunit|nr:efflux RND transporter periplasmic adaptor subunit [Bryobacteraceae bacterium]
MSENRNVLGRILKVIAVLALLSLLAFGVLRGINTRIKAAANVKQETIDMSVPTVTVVHPKRGALKDEIVLPGNIQAFTVSPIYARINGYLKKWYFDIGGRVKTGQLLAEIEAPEVDKQLDQSRADLATAEANLTLSQSTMVRWQELLRKDAVAKQETDDRVGDFQAKKATVDSGRANVKRLEDMVSFEKVYAPFDGVITTRNTDIGSLINAGNGGLAQQLFTLAATDVVRVFVNVPQIYSRSASPGVMAQLTLTEYPNRRFSGKIARNAESIDPSMRTLLTEVDVNNSTGELLPGAFAQVHLTLAAKAPSLLLPVNSLLFRAEGLQVGVVRDGGKVELVPIVIGRDYGTEVEVVSAGLTENDNVVVNPPDSLATGTTVRMAAAKK